MKLYKGVPHFLIGEHENEGLARPDLFQ